MDSTDNDEGPPITSLDDVRQRRRAEAERAERLRQEQELRAAQHEIVTGALLDKTLMFEEVMDMVRLGITSDDPKYLPCKDRGRDQNYYDWVTLAKDLPRAEELRAARLRESYPGEPEWIRKERAEPSPRHTVVCPVMASAVLEEIPPCIEAYREQIEHPPWVPEKGQIIRELDPEHPVVKYAVRPCMLIGYHGAMHVLRPAALRRSEDNEE